MFNTYTTMRISQFAKKYEIPAQDIVAFLKETTGEKFHPNAKLYDTLESTVFDHFNLAATDDDQEEVPVEEESPEVNMQLDHAEKLEHDAEELEIEVVDQQEEALPMTPEEEIAAIEGEIEEIPEPSPVLVEATDNQEVMEEQEDEVAPPSEDEIIQTDKLLELLESEELPEDLDKIKLIKAPKKELSGLKVVGKIDLPEPKKKEEKQPEEKEVLTERDLREYRNPRRKKRAPLTEEEKEKRRLRAKRKKEEYEARQEKRKKQQEAQRLKELKAKHYQKKLQKPTPQEKQKLKAKSAPQPSSKKKVDTRPKPKTIFGKFWRWLNPIE